MAIIGQRVNLLPVVKEKCRKYGANAALMDAIITVESGYDPWAVRYEPKFGNIAIPTKFASNNGISVETERTCQKMSWGVAQIMGGTARYLGFNGPLTQMLDPDLNIAYCCRLLVKLASDYHDINDQIAGYNAGTPQKMADGKYRNQAYVDKVLKLMDEK